MADGFVDLAGAGRRQHLVDELAELSARGLDRPVGAVEDRQDRRVRRVVRGEDAEPVRELRAEEGEVVVLVLPGAVHEDHRRGRVAVGLQSVPVVHADRIDARAARERLAEGADEALAGTGRWPRRRRAPRRRWLRRAGAMASRRARVDGRNTGQLLGQRCRGVRAGWTEGLGCALWPRYVGCVTAVKQTGGRFIWRIAVLTGGTRESTPKLRATPRRSVCAPNMSAPPDSCRKGRPDGPIRCPACPPPPVPRRLAARFVAATPGSSLTSGRPGVGYGLGARDHRARSPRQAGAGDAAGRRRCSLDEWAPEARFNSGTERALTLARLAR